MLVPQEEPKADGVHQSLQQSPGLVEQGTDDANVDVSALANKRILLTGINYWPEETGIAPYTTGLAEHLASLGANITILSGMPYYPGWKVPSEYSGQFSMVESRNGVTIKRFRQYVPTSQSAFKRAATELSFMTNVLRLARLQKPDAILGVIPSVCGGAMAALAAKRFHVPYGVLVQDLSGQAALQTGIQGGARVAKLTSALEGQILRGAASVAIIAEGFQRHVLEMGVSADRIHRVRNWTHIDPPRSSVAATRARLGIPQDAWVAMHAGNMGLKQGLENVVEAARLAKESSDPTIFVFVGDGNQRTFLQEQAAELDNVVFFPPQPEDEFADVLACANVLLVNQKPEVVDMCLPGKLTSYLAVERPVVAAVAPASDTAVELRRADAGVVIAAGEPRALLSAIQELEQDHDRAADLAKRGKVFALEHLTADKALQNLETFIQSIIMDSMTATRSSTGSSLMRQEI